MTASLIYSPAAEAGGLDRFKAATILNLIKYMDIGKSNNLDICISGDDNLKKIIDKYLEKRPNNKISEVNFFKTASKEIEKCDFLFISSKSRSLSASVIGISSGSQKRQVTISDIDGFIRKSGGLVEIYEENGRIRFSLNLKKAKSENISINSKLIESASNVY